MKKLIKAAPAGLSNPYDGEDHDLDIALADYIGDDRVGKAIVFSSAELNEGFENADSDVKELLNFDVDGEEITITPSTEEQIITPTQGKNAILKATVNPAAIDTVSPVTPTTSEQTINPGTGKLGIASVTVNAVTSAIDANITAENIKKDVVILGVTGTYEATSEDYALFYDRSDYEGNSWSDAVEANDAGYVKAFIDAFRPVSENAIPVKIIYSGDTNTEVGTGLFDSSAYSIEFHPAGGGTFNIEIEQDPDTQEDVVVVHEVVTDDDEELGVI